MINIDNVEKFVTEELCAGENFSLRKEGWIELITRLREAEKDAARWNYVINNQCIGGMNMGLYADYNYGMDIVTKDDAIAIVDEAMKCK